MTRPETLLELCSVARTYDDGAPVHALRSTSLSIHERDYLTITGPSGAGKSTLLNILGLLDRPTSGSYHVRGVDSASAPERARVAMRSQLFGFVFQEFHLLAGRSTRENVELGMLYGRRSASTRRRLAEQAMERVGLQHRAHADPRTLSGGERQRAAVARAIAGRPTVLLCDEPTGNLDSNNTTNILELLDELHTDGFTLLVVTHAADIAARGQRTVSVLDGYAVEESECAG